MEKLNSITDNNEKKTKITKIIFWAILLIQSQVSYALEIHTSTSFIDWQISRFDDENWNIDELKEFIEQEWLNFNFKISWWHMDIDNFIWWYADWRYDLDSYSMNEIEENYYNVRLKFVKDRKLPIPHYENIQIYNKWRYIVIKHWRNFVKVKIDSTPEPIKIWDINLELELIKSKRFNNKRYKRRHYR